MLRYKLIKRSLGCVRVANPLIIRRPNSTLTRLLKTEHGEKTESKHHYFDTLEVYKELINAGFTDIQSNRVIQLFEASLNKNLDNLVKKSVPKMDLENENYLFEAASSELKVEVKRTRESHLNELQISLNLLDHELNSVRDELNDLMTTCKNECEVAMNDHKSDITLLQKKLTISIREIENRINSELITELKFGIENLRWSLTRRGIFCILSVAASVLLAVTSSKIVSMYGMEKDDFDDKNVIYEDYEEWHEPKSVEKL